MNGEHPLYLTQILDISFSFLTPSLLAFRGINQQIRDQKQRTEKRHSLETNQPKGYTAVNGYFGVNAVAQSGPGIQK